MCVEEMGGHDAKSKLGEGLNIEMGVRDLDLRNHSLVTSYSGGSERVKINKPHPDSYLLSLLLPSPSIIRSPLILPTSPLHPH